MIRYRSTRIPGTRPDRLGVAVIVDTKAANKHSSLVLHPGPSGICVFYVFFVSGCCLCVPVSRVLLVFVSLSFACFCVSVCCVFVCSCVSVSCVFLCFLSPVWFAVSVLLTLLFLYFFCSPPPPPPISALIQVGLPGAVEAHESVGGVPESVWKKVQTVKQGGGGLIELKEKVCIEAVQSEEPQ